jgi:hypothetical protein
MVVTMEPQQKILYTLKNSNRALNVSAISKCSGVSRVTVKKNLVRLLDEKVVECNRLTKTRATWRLNHNITSYNINDSMTTMVSFGKTAL